MLPGMEKRFPAQWINLGRMEYDSASRLQVQLSRRLQHGSDLSGYLLFLEHPPTITLGYSMREEQERTWLRVSEEFLNRRGVNFFYADRGGKATYHGPGQLVVYPVLNLAHFGFSGRQYVAKLEQCAIGWLARIGINAQRDPDYPGVWVEKKKIASVGVRIENRVSRHGLAVNLSLEPNGFNWIIPCGIQGRGMTSVRELAGVTIDPDQAIAGLCSRFEEFFCLNLKPADQEEILGKGGADDDQGMVDARAV